MYRIEQYTASHYNLWNDFIQRSKNGTFLFHRDFMEYHSDRFRDFSLLIFEGEKLVAVMPANRVGEVIHSHQGLTYGGLLLTEKVKQAAVIVIFEKVLAYLYSNGITALVIKTIPFIYHKLPAQETEYALYLADAALVRRDSLSVIEAAGGFKIASNRMTGVKRGKSMGFKVEEHTDFSSFWDLLTAVLHKKHNTFPVHSLQEIMLLKARFPENIRLFAVSHKGEIAAGTVLFETDTVVHAQYIAGSEDKSETGSLDFLFHELITGIFKNKKFFDFGTSNEQQGKKLNGGLAFWKEGFGARTIVQDFYEVNTANYPLLTHVII